ncbi:MAG: ATP-binding protein [Byssovorax sp.]
MVDPDASPPPESRSYREADYAIALEALRALPAALLVVREDGTTMLANRQACAVLGRSRAQLEGAPVASYLAPVSELKSPLSCDDRSGRLRVTLPTKRAATLGFSIAELRDLDGPAFTVILKDLTEVERTRDERDRLLQIATVHEVLPAILHEIKNPLAAIATTAELLFEESAEEQGRSAAHAILREARRMKLTLQGIGAVGVSLRASRHAAIDHAVREACSILSARAESLGLVTRCRIADLPLLPLDPSVVCAMVLNLVTNAMQACKPGGEVVLFADIPPGSQELLLRVSDTGAGMTPEVLARCRELFFTTKTRGTGIGLALCDRALRDAGGSMDIDSEPGRGTQITLHIPLQPALAPAQRSDRPFPSPSEEPS